MMTNTAEIRGASYSRDASSVRVFTVIHLWPTSQFILHGERFINYTYQGIITVILVNIPPEY